MKLKTSLVLFERRFNYDEFKKPLGGGHKSLGFTLAEVLITLAIIGIVAALTIPTVVNNYQKKAYYTQFMKTYNTLTTAMSLAVADNGTPNNWTYNSNNPSQALKTYLYPYLKISSICEEENSANCFSLYDIKYLNGDHATTSSEGLPGSGLSVTLQDGSIIVFYPTENYDNPELLAGVLFAIDTNGAKGPNVIGRDIFNLNYSPKVGNPQWHFWFPEQLRAEYCDPSGDSDEGVGAGCGNGCADRLLKTGKMDY